jgi:hypothetical protein
MPTKNGVAHLQHVVLSAGFPQVRTLASATPQYLRCAGGARDDL